ncbi:hypothetical protein llap_8115 [Limosa lapponica baueri]|uniref:Uncharacterized protein n=1 Tax=Limosa lapponica baueri TaxID=1758121 RepID=A0A2I0U6D8_LIMLA|nr:hypothetical protein llap_8115 [Limosa lapponica baueri]
MSSRAVPLNEAQKSAASTEEFVALVNLKRVKPFPLILWLPSLIKSPSPAFLEPLEGLEGALRSPRSLLFSSLNPNNPLSPSSQQKGSSPPSISMTSSGPTPTDRLVRTWRNNLYRRDPGALKKGVDTWRWAEVWPVSREAKVSHFQAMTSLLPPSLRCSKKPCLVSLLDDHVSSPLLWGLVALVDSADKRGISEVALEGTERGSAPETLAMGGKK